MTRREPLHGASAFGGHNDRVLLGIAVLLAIIAVAGCRRHEKKPVHVPLVAYTAHINDKDCKQIAKDPPKFKCNNVVLDPREINVKDSR